MAEEQNVGYGYTDDAPIVNPFNFGLNTGAILKKFEWIPNGGKDGAEGEAVDIVFEIAGVEKGYRQFPITKAFGKDNVEITDQTAPEFKEAVKESNQRIVHILQCFHTPDVVKATLSRPFSGFKDFIKTCEGLLPKDFNKIELDIFLQYQWQIGSNASKTYLEIPKKTNYGKFLTPSVKGTSWKELKKDNPEDKDKAALVYVTYKEDGVTIDQYHSFVRTGWFMNSHFATQQKDSSAGNTETASTSVAPATATSGVTGAAAKSAW